MNNQQLNKLKSTLEEQLGKKPYAILIVEDSEDGGQDIFIGSPLETQSIEDLLELTLDQIAGQEYELVHLNCGEHTPADEHGAH